MCEMVYLDNCATTQIYDCSYRAMLPYIKELYGNPSAMYKFSIKIKNDIERAREVIASTLKADKSEIFFTSGGTEGDNWAILSICNLMKNKGKHIITTKVEHKAVLNTCRYLESKGYSVTYLNVNRYGEIDLEELKLSIREDTILISIMMANNEVGTLMPIEQIAEIAKERDIIFHTDAVQAYGHIPINVQQVPVDLLCVSAHKFHGPKGVGFLYVRKGVEIDPLIHGGNQEKGLRAGTENTAAIIGMAVAAKNINDNLIDNMKKITSLRDYLINRVLDEVPNVTLTGHRFNRNINNVSFCIEGVRGIILVSKLSKFGICIASGSACNTSSIKPSHVLLAMGYSTEESEEAIRVSLSEFNTKEEIDYFIDKLKSVVRDIRDWM